jgi:hypothetical protein
MLVDHIIDRLQECRDGGEAQAGAWAIFFGVTVGTGPTVAVSLGLLLGLAQVPADIPEGFPTIATWIKNDEGPISLTSAGNEGDLHARSRARPEALLSLP